MNEGAEAVNWLIRVPKLFEVCVYEYTPSGHFCVELAFVSEISKSDN